MVVQNYWYVQERNIQNKLILKRYLSMEEYFKVGLIQKFRPNVYDLYAEITFENKRPMGHIAYLSNTGLYETFFSNIKYVFHSLLPHLTLGAIILTNLPMYCVGSCKNSVLVKSGSAKSPDFRQPFF
jgi:hypothetical protein